MKYFKIKYLSVIGVAALLLAACAPGQAGDNPGPFGATGMPGSSDTAGGPTPEIQPGGVSQTAQPPGNTTPAVVASSEAVTDSTQTANSTSEPAADATSGAPAVEANATDAVPAPTVQPSEVLTSEQIQYGVIQATISSSIVPSVTAQILPVQLEAISQTSSTSETVQTPLTGTILTLQGFTQLNPDSPTYQQPRIMVMPLESYVPAEAAATLSATTAASSSVISLGNPFFDALRLVSEGDNQAIFSSGQLQQSGLYNQSPALSLGSEVTVVLNAEPLQLDFANGKGVRFVSAITERQGTVTADNLYYFYHGLTDDQRYYVAVILPIQNASLTMTPTVAGATPAAGEDYDKYLQGVEQQLDSGNDPAFEAALADYDRIVSSIRVTP